jgi:hypothetical protein
MMRFLALNVKEFNPHLLLIILKKCHHFAKHRDNPELTERFELMVVVRKLPMHIQIK